MWRLFLEQLLRDIERQVVRQGKSQGVQKVGLDLIGEANKPEAYADRINREFNLRDYAKAWNLYGSNCAYWEKLYGDDPLTSLDHPVSPPKSLLPHQPDTQSLVPSPIGSMPPDAIDDNKPERRLGVRIGDKPGSTVFDVGAPAVPFFSPNPIPLPGRPTTFDQRFEASSSSAPDGTSSNDLEGFRRRWLKTFMEP